MANRRGKSGSSDRFSFFGFQNHCGWWLKLWNWKMLSPWQEGCEKSRQHIKRQKHHFANRSPYSQSYDFSSSHVQIWELDHKKGWVPKNWFFRIVVLEKTLESPLDCSEIRSVNPKGNQLWIFIGKTDAETETLVLWPPDSKNWLIGRVWKKLLRKFKIKGGGRRRQRMRWLDSITNINGHEFEGTPGNNEGQRRLVCYSTGVTKSQTWLSNWKTTTTSYKMF